MRVLMLVHNRAYVGGGTFYRALHLGEALARRGMEVTLVASGPCPPAQGTARERSVRLVCLPGMLPPRWRYGYDFFEAALRTAWVRSRPAWDIVHAFDSRPTVIYPALAARQRGAALVLDWSDWFGRGGAVEERSRPLMRALLRPLETFFEEHYRLRAEGATVITTALENRLREMGFPQERILPLKNGVYPERFRLLSAEEARVGLALPPDLQAVGYLGSLFPRDAKLLAQAMRHVQETLPDTFLILVGNPKASIPPLDNLVRAGFLQPALLDRWLRACDVLALPLSDTVANRGRWPSKLGDYFASGRPVVACDVGDAGKVLRETGAGLAVPPTAEGLAAGLLKLLQDAALRRTMGTAGRRAAETAFHWEDLGARLAQFYERIRHAGD